MRSIIQSLIVLTFALAFLPESHAQYLSTSTSSAKLTTKILYQVFSPTSSGSILATDPQMIRATDPQMIRATDPQMIKRFNIRATDPQM
jgi:hypothetical protein